MPKRGVARSFISRRETSRPTKRLAAPARISFFLCASLALTGFLSACAPPSPPLKALPADAVILAFGDSLTKGGGAELENSYPSVLAQQTGRTVVNAGVPGELSADGLARLPGVLDDVQPRLLILCHGGNDMLRKRDLSLAADNIRAMVELALTRGVEVLLIGVPKPGLLLGTAPLYEDIARSMNIPFEAEVLNEVLSDRSMKSDPVHPNAKGYARIAEAIYQELKKAGALK